MPNLRKITLVAAWLLLGIFVPATIAGRFSRFDLIGEICSYFCVQYSIVFLITAALFAAVKSVRGVAISIVFATINFASYIPLSFGPSASERLAHASPSRLKVFYMNVNYGNDQYSYAIDSIRRLQPDVVAVSELTEAWARQLEDGLTEYQYKIVEPRPDAFGIALFSKIPINDGCARYWGPAMVPSLVANLTFDGKPLSIIATHPVPPLSTIGFDYRNEQLSQITRHKDEFNKSLIVLADFNATGWSYWFQKFQDDLHLLDTRIGFGVLQTWPDAHVPSPMNLIFVPLDHILASSDWITLNRAVGPRIGSDHLPVFAELARRK